MFRFCIRQIWENPQSGSHTTRDLYNEISSCVWPAPRILQGNLLFFTFTIKTHFSYRLSYPYYTWPLVRSPFFEIHITIYIDWKLNSELPKEGKLVKKHWPMVINRIDIKCDGSSVCFGWFILRFVIGRGVTSKFSR